MSEDRAKEIIAEKVAKEVVESIGEDLAGALVEYANLVKDLAADLTDEQLEDGSDAAIEVIKAYLDGALESLDIKSDTYPAEKAKLTDRVNAKRFIGFCGKDCRTCDNMGCLGKKE